MITRARELYMKIPLHEISDEIQQIFNQFYDENGRILPELESHAGEMHCLSGLIPILNERLHNEIPKEGE